MRHSALQKQILKLYRDCLHAAYSKPVDTRSTFVEVVRREFRKNQALPRTDVAAIEYLLRNGQKRLKILQSDSVMSVTDYTAG